ncbi:MAG: hypothetical protein HYT31_01090 [Parcubacteria group bacterium]|nr:hypothetical protein [Parcubacteria group bacterium]
MALSSNKTPLLLACTLAFARIQETEFRVCIRPNGEPPIPLPWSEAGLERLKAEHRGAFRHIAQEGLLAVLSEHPLVVALGWEEYGIVSCIG